jgi:hypothetical protein
MAAEPLDAKSLLLNARLANLPDFYLYGILLKVGVLSESLDGAH